jgi:hypothetical protein
MVIKVQETVAVRVAVMLPKLKLVPMGPRIGAKRDRVTLNTHVHQENKKK